MRDRDNDDRFADRLNGLDRARMRRQRLTSLFAAMDRHEVQAIVAFEYANCRYVADLRPLWAPNFLVRQAVVAVGGNDRLIVFVHQDDTPHRRATMDWIAPADVREFPTGIANFGAAADAVAPLVRALDELGAPRDARVATDIGTVASIQNLEASLATRHLVDAGACMRDARTVKNEDELRIMRFASAVSDLAMERAIAAIEPGVRECDVLAEAMATLYRFGAEIPQCNLIVCAGPNTMPMQRFAGERPIEPGDLVMLDLGACFHGMFSELARTTTCGEPNRRQRAVYQTASAIHEAALGALVPGATYRDVQDAAGVPYRGSPFDGLMQRMIIAHGIGVGYAEAPFIPPPGGSPASSDPIAVGTTLAIVPTLLVPGVPGGGGVRIEDVVAFGPSGVERLTRHPYDAALLG
jgi:Xaa-Pro aminopeptidase